MKTTGRVCVVIGAREPGPMEIPEGAFVIVCDGGYQYIKDIRPDLIIGDFDSHENPHLAVETIVLPCEKDDTDTVFAAKEAIRRGFDEVLLIGVTGGRLDHTLGNISILLYLDALGKQGRIIDDYSELEIVSTQPVSVDDRYAFFSLLNITGCARGITVTGAKYPLQDAEIPVTYQYGISNEVLPGETAVISVSDGKVLLVKVRA